MLTVQRTLLITLTLFVLMCATALVSLAIGTVHIPISEMMSLLLGGSISEEHRIILLSIRLPRVLLAVIVGGGLSIAGAVLQAILRNPLAEPFVLGISSGGTLGAVLAIAFGLGLSMVSIPLSSFIGSAGVMFLVYVIASRYGRIDPTTLLLAGIVVGAFFNAMILALVAIFQREVQNAFLWLMGNLASANFGSLSFVGPIVLGSSVVLASMGRSYNLISTGEETAGQLGVNVQMVTRASYLLASLITGLVVSMSGVIGFVGLIVPHSCRLLFGPDHRLLLPASFLAGSSFLIIVDLIARTAISPAEIPVGALTAVLGAPVFVWLLRRK